MRNFYLFWGILLSCLIFGYYFHTKGFKSIKHVIEHPVEAPAPIMKSAEAAK